ncbi:MAG: radical SAM protein [Clostridia bacterium]|nr:radical SAM protein [Clostridia bacterium]
MKDHLGRSIEYLRLSLTERCTLMCTYCRKAEGHCPKAQELSAKEFARIARVMAEIGVNKIRLTGGEPMLRRGVMERASSHPELLFPIFTNGTMIEDGYLKLFQKNRNLLPLLSIEGGEEETDNRNRKVDRI